MTDEEIAEAQACVDAWSGKRDADGDLNEGPEWDTKDIVRVLGGSLDTLHKLRQERDEALGRIALALNVVNNPAGEYRRGGSSSDAVQDMVCALEGCAQTEDGTWIEGA